MSSPENRDLVRTLAADGWRIRPTRGGHLQARHPLASGVLHISATPSDWRADRNTLAQARRLLRTGAP